jgi:uncharacterized repeat protein (TIGR02543 family)
MNISSKSRPRKFLVLVISLGLLTSLVATAPSAFATSASVTYNSNGGTGTAPTDSTVYTVGDSVTVLGSNGLTKNGFTFGGWASGGGLGPSTTYQSGGTFSISADTQLTAVWNAVAVTYSVTYNGNGFTGGTVPIDSGAYASGATVTVAGQNGLSRTGYTFGGWASGGGAGPGATYQPGQTFTIQNNTTLTAVWNAVVVTYSVTYNGNGFTGGSTPIDSAAYTSGATVTVAGQNGLVRTGYTFGGWASGGGAGPGATYQPGQTFTIQTNTTLTAVWNAVAVFTMKYNGLGSTGGIPPVDPNTYALGATVTVLGAGTLVKVGYSFGGWQDCVVNTHYGTTFTITGNTVACPIWTINPYAVHYLATGSISGTPPNDPNSPYPSGATVTVLGAGSLVKTGFHFGGWADADTHIATGPTFIILKVTDLEPVWIPDLYTVTYDGNCSNSCGAVPTDGTSYSPNASVIVGVTPNANYSGFHFTGWRIVGGTVYQPGAHFAIVSNTILTAVWVANLTYTVTYFPYQTSGGTPPVDLLNPYSSGDVVFVLGAGTLFKAGYTFNGWGYCPAINTIGTSFAIHVDTTLCSLWVVDAKFKVTYLGNGQSTGNPPPIASGAGYIAILGNTGSMTKSGYTFSGWNTKANGLGTPYAIGFQYNRIADLTLYAVWTPAKVSYRITYDGNGNSSGTAPPQTVGAGAIALATNSGSMARVGQHLTAWNTNSAGTGVRYPLGGNYNLVANITLYALWVPDTFTITYDGNGNTTGVIPNPTVGSGSVTLATNSGALSKSGSNYGGWNTAAAGSGTSYAVGDPYTLNANITLYAVWIPATYAVTYLGNGNTGGTVPIDITAYSSGGTVIVLGPNTLDKTGFTFGGWALGGLAIYAPGSTFTITGDTTLTAVWTPNVVYTINYSGNGNSSGSVPIPTIGSGLVTLATNSGALVKSGSSFDGWNTAVDGSGTPYAVGTPYTLNANITLYAVWIGGGITNYTLTYNGNGFTSGTAPSPTVGLGSVTLATNSGALGKSGSTFGGWNTVADGSGTPYAVGSNYTLLADIMLYAVWHPSAIPVYTITYLGNGYTSGSAPLPTVGLGSVSLATNSGALGKSGSTFGGWNTSADGSETPYSVGSNYTLLADITLYAVWHSISTVYTITYLGNTNTGGVAPQPTIGAGSVNLAINSSPLVKSSSVFGGWNTSAGGTGTPYAVGSGYTLLADVNLYAVWKAANSIYTITYLGNTNTGGVVPSPTVGSGSVTLAANSSPLVKTASTFGGWNTKADSTGTSYATRSNYNLTANITLYAVWSTSTTYTITYLGNGSSGGTVPTSTLGSGLVVLATNSGGLTKTGYTFSGWNTKVDRTGASYLVGSNYNLTSNATLFAAYIPLPISQAIPDIIANGKIINTAPQKKIALNQIVPVHQQFITVLPSNVVGFELYENSRLINRGTSTKIDLTQIVGPKDRVTVMAVSKDGLKSNPAPVSLAKEPISLANINFNTDSYKFIGPATKILDQVAAVIIQHGYTVLEIWGYVDTQGSKASWITLSNNRAKAVKNYMTKKLKGSGVLIKNAGRAQTQAVGNNKTAEGRALNRRVEVRVS